MGPLMPQAIAYLDLCWRWHQIVLGHVKIGGVVDAVEGDGDGDEFLLGGPK